MASVLRRATLALRIKRRIIICDQYEKCPEFLCNYMNILILYAIFSAITLWSGLG